MYHYGAFRVRHVSMLDVAAPCCAPSYMYRVSEVVWVDGGRRREGGASTHPFPAGNRGIRRAGQTRGAELRKRKCNSKPVHIVDPNPHYKNPKEQFYTGIACNSPILPHVSYAKVKHLKVKSKVADF